MQYEHGGNVHRYLRDSETPIENLLDYSANINPLGLSEMGKKRMLEGLAWIGHYPDPQYTALIEKLSGYYHVKSSEIGVFNGAAEGLHELVRFLRPKRAIIPAPAFVEYEKALQAVGCEIEWFELRECHCFQINEQRFLMTIELERPDLIVLCTPNNPTGAILSIDFIEKVTELARRWHGSVMIDEAFFDFLPIRTKSAALLTSLYPNLFVMKSFTKFFGVPGLRLGAMLTTNQGFLEHIRLYGVPWRVNVMAEQYAIGAIEDVAYQGDTRALIEMERAYIVSALEQMSDVVCYPSSADYLMFKCSPEQSELLERQLNAEGILIRNCSNYRGLGKGYFRIAVKARLENNRLLQAIAKVLK